MSSAVINAGIVIATVAAMEWVAYATHKYLMHGSMWSWHESHHRPRLGRWERNDRFALIFTIPSILLIYFGVNYLSPLLYLGIGMTVYGFLYFFVHDGLVHHRWPVRIVPRHGYLRRLVQAHLLHHAVDTKDGAVSFGFLYAPPVRELKAQLQRLSAPTA